MAMEWEALLRQCMTDDTVNAFLERLNNVISKTSEGVPNEIGWLSEFVRTRENCGNFAELTKALLKNVLEQTAKAWADQIGSHQVEVGYTGTVDLDTAMSTRQSKATAFLNFFRDVIRNSIITVLLDTYSDNSWSQHQKVSFSTLVLEPVALQRVYAAHCNMLGIPATFDDVLRARSEEELIRDFDIWKQKRATSLVVLNFMLKAFFLAGYGVYRRVYAVCESKRSYKLKKSVHEVS